MSLNRRGFLAAIAGAVTTAAAVDPERLLWVPGRKLISIPAPARIVTPPRLSIRIISDYDYVAGRAKYRLDVLAHEPTDQINKLMIEPTIGLTLREFCSDKTPEVARLYLRERLKFHPEALARAEIQIDQLGSPGGARRGIVQWADAPAAPLFGMRLAPPRDYKAFIEW